MQKIQNGKWADLNLMDQDYLEAMKEKCKRLDIIIDANNQKSDF